MANGILLLNKPAGPSSARVLGPLKRVQGTKKIGHTGTLDPFASGLLVLMVNGATRLSSRFTALDKEYEAVVCFGQETDTLDPEGVVVATATPPAPGAVLSVLPQFTGEIQQTPPQYSAIHVGGERAYARARRGETVEMQPRSVHVHSIALTAVDSLRYRMIVRCGSGTYIRSLVRDIARAASSVASLEALHRTAVGPFHVREAVEWDQFDSSEKEGAPLPLIPVPEALQRLGPITIIPVSPDLEKLVRQGRELNSPSLAPLLPVHRDFRLQCLLVTEEGRELALCEHTPSRWIYRAVFAE
jgi:tRNA pseudouridine55 synthase